MQEPILPMSVLVAPEPLPANCFESIKTGAFNAMALEEFSVRSR